MICAAIAPPYWAIAAWPVGAKQFVGKSWVIPNGDSQPVSPWRSIVRFSRFTNRSE
ncbi:hypothetical protein [Halomicronema sp. CCY15110]|uniref:hypothetical protein n=1 Tax=Halomicronema sp. CCY15110 TaxID=2767773 RepID=UPI0019519FB0|nr:hypothetical protein [Halomicronema sp. CCY15110]